MVHMERLAVVIPAAGVGSRMHAQTNKALLNLGGEPMVLRTVRQFWQHRAVQGIVLAVRQDEMLVLRELLDAAGLTTVQLCVGGSTRQESVHNGLQALPASTRWVAVHDAARPLVDAATISEGFTAVQRWGAVGVGVPVKDTIKVVETGVIKETPDRTRLWQVQTPQLFAYDLLLRAHEAAAATGWQGTDDCSLVERLGEPVYMVTGRYTNIKITTPEDMLVAQALLAAAPAQNGGSALVGFGYDVHAFAEDRPLILCGTVIPHTVGLAGHSDADVAVHALMDALLGAAGLGDIGRHFPDTDAAYAGADSMELLNQVLQLLARERITVNNVDITIAAQAPKLAPFMGAMQERLAGALSLPPQRVNIKATTTEKLGFVGRREGMAAYAAVSCSAG